MNDDIKLAFDIDLDSLISSLSKVNKSIVDALNADAMNSFDKKIADVSSRVNGLIGVFENLSSKQTTAILKANENIGTLINQLNKAAEAYARVGNASASLASGGLADILASRAGTGGATGFPGPYGRTTGGRFASAQQYSDAQIAKQMNQGILQAQKELNAEMLVADKNMAAQNEAIQIASYNAIYAKAEAALAAYQASTVAQQGLWTQKMRAAQAQLMQGGGIFTNAWEQNLTGTNEKLSTMRDNLAGLGVNMGTVDRAARSWLERNISLLGQHIVQWGGFIVLFQTFMALQQAVSSGLKEGVTTAAEFQQQMVQLQSFQRVSSSAGIGLNPAASNQVWEDASRLAIKYGDNVNDVVQDLTLWYKTTGDLSNAMYLTNEAMKFQVVTGTSLEDTYRTLTALQNQASGMKMGLGDNSSFNLSKSAEFLNMIYNAALVAGAGMKQFAGDELTTANAANILMHAMEQDTESLKQLGLSVAQAIAIDQSLITVMGNTGAGADSAAERIARLVGGFAELSRVAKATSLSKDIGPEAYKNLQGMAEQMDKIAASGKSQGDTMATLLEYWESLSGKQRNALATALAGNRQYQIMMGLIDSISGIYEKILKSERDKQSLDQAAKAMNDTFNQQVKQLASEWQVVAKIIAQELIPALEGAISLAGKFAVGIAGVRANAAGNSAIDKLAQQAGIAPTASTHLVGFGRAAIATTDADYFQGMQAKFSEKLSNMYQLANNQQKKSLAAIQYTIDHATGSENLIWSLSANRSAVFGGKSFLDVAGGKFAAGSEAAQAGTLLYENSHLRELMKLPQFNPNGLGLGANSGSGGGIFPADPTAKGGATRDAAQQGKTALDALIDAYHRYADATKDATAGDDAQIAALDRKMQLYGQNTTDMNRMVALYADEDNRLTVTNQHLKGYQEALEKNIASYTKAQSVLPKNSQQYSQYQSDIDKAGTELNSVNHTIQENSDKLTENQYKIIGVQNALAQTNFSKFMTEAQKELSNAYKQYQDGLLSLTQEEAIRNAFLAKGTELVGQFAKGTTDAANAQTQLGEATGSANTEIVTQVQALAKTLQDDVSKYQGDFMSSMIEVQKILGGPGMEAQLTYEKQMLDLKKQQADAQVEIAKLVQQSQGTPFEQQAEQVQGLSQAYFAAAASAAQLQERQTEMTNSPIYKAITGTLDNASTQISDGLYNQLFGINADNAAIQNIDAEINALNQKKSLLDQIYQSQQYHSQAQAVAHAEQMYNIQQEITALNNEKQAEQDKISHPSLLKTLAADFVKELSVDFLKQMSTQALASVFKIKPDPALQAAIDNFHTYAQQDFSQPVQDFIDSIGGTSGGDYTFVGAVANFGQYVQNFVNATGSGTPGSTGGGSWFDNILQGTGTSFFGGGSNSVPGSSSPFSIGRGSSGPGSVYSSGSGSSSSPGLGSFLPAALGIGGVAAMAIPALASSLRMPGVPTGGAGLPLNGAGGGTNFTPSWQGSSISSVLQDAGFLSAAPPGSGGLNATDNWLPAMAAGAVGTGAFDLSNIFGGSSTNPAMALGLPSISPNASPADIFGAYMSIPGGLGKAAGAIPGVAGTLGAGKGSPFAAPALTGKSAAGVPFTGMWSDAGSLGKYLGIAGAAYGLYSSITGGGGIGNALSAAMSMAAIAGWTGPVGIGLDALAFLAGFIGIGNHDVPANMPDKYNTQVYGQGMADLFAAGLNGHPTWGANGTQFTMNPALAQMTGGIGMKNFIEQTLAKYPTQASAPAWLQPMYNNLLKMFGNSATPGQDVMHWGHNIGQEWITGPGADGQVRSYTDYLNAMNQFVNAYTSNLQSASQATIIALNQFGSAVGFLPGFWDTPGYDYGNNPPPITNEGGSGTGTGGGTPPPNPPGGSKPPPGWPPGKPWPPPVGGGGGYPGGGGKEGNLKSAYNYSPSGHGGTSTIGGQIHVAVNMDGRQVARSTQAYQLRAGRQGFSRVT